MAIRKITETTALILVAALFVGLPTAVGAGPRGVEYSFAKKYLEAPLYLSSIVIVLGIANFTVGRWNAGQIERIESERHGR